MTDCFFCRPVEPAPMAESPMGLAFPNRHPVSPGHTLIIPKRHVLSFFDLTLEEQTDLLRLTNEVVATLDRELKPAGFNFGLNDGVAAGQIIMHACLHLIPRYKGDRPDPRGGIRWIFPEKATDWDVGG